MRRPIPFSVVAAICAALLPLVSSAADPDPATLPDTTGMIEQPSQAEAKAVEAWHTSLVKTPAKKPGCYEATYPNSQWQEVACTTAPRAPYLPTHSAHPNTVGNGTDFTAQVSSGLINNASGELANVTGVTSISGGSVFSLQVNSNFFTSPRCNGAANPAASQGWQQFIFANNSQTGTAVAGTAAPGDMDMAVVDSNRHAYSVQNSDSVLSLSQGWTTAEFNVFGDGNASQAVFNPGSTLLVETALHNGNIRAAAPTCIVTGTTGETNNLTLVSPCCSVGGRMQAIKFIESNTSAAPPPCS